MLQAVSKNLVLTCAVLVTMVVLVLGITMKAHALTSLSRWNSHFVLTLKSHRYWVSTSRITGVGAYLGAISFHGSASGSFRLYSIPGIPNNEAIAVQTQTGYLLAVEK